MLWRAYKRWRAHAGPFAAYVLPTPFFAETHPRPVAPAHPHAVRLARGVELLVAAPGALSLGDGEGVAQPAVGPAFSAPALVFLEASPRLGLATGARLLASGWTVVPMFGRWPADPAVLPVERLAAWLIAAGERAQPTRDSSRVCFLLDAGRAGRASPRALRRCFDNRYVYGTYMLPPPAKLQEQLIRESVWIVGRALLAEDVAPYVGALAVAGISVRVVRLEELCER